jgi:hypothetical protein
MLLKSRHTWFYPLSAKIQSPRAPTTRSIASLQNSTHYFFGHPHNFAIDQPEVTRSIHQAVVDAFDEDRDMVTAQQRNLSLDPDFRMLPFGIDAALSRFRWVVNQRLEDERQAREQPVGEGQHD